MYANEDRFKQGYKPALRSLAKRYFCLSEVAIFEG